MVHNLSLVHVLLGLAAVACIYLAAREVRRSYVSQWPLFAPAAAALFVAAELFLIQITAGSPAWTFGAAAVAGMAIGGIRGLSIGVKHDLYRPQMMISRPAKLVLLWVALGVGVCAGLEIVGAFSDNLEKVRYWAALSAIVCAMAMLARALVLAIRLHRHI
ncbi:MAG: hypothetical protein ACOY4R_18865 [Pseudomonadota bacterium]